MTATITSTTAEHPLSMLSEQEISAAVAVARESGRLGERARFAHVALQEPPKDEVRAFKVGDPVDRRVRLVIVNGPHADVIEAVVSVTRGVVTSWVEVADARPALLIEESMHVISALRADPTWQAAMRRRGIEDLDARPDRPVARRDVRSRARGGPAHQPLPQLPAEHARGQRLRPPHRRRHRLRRHGAGRGARGPRHRCGAAPARARELLPRARRAAAPRPAPARDHPTGRPELQRGGEPRALATVVTARVHGPARGPGPAHRRLRGRRGRPTRSSTVPPSARWSSPTEIPASCTDGRAPSTWGSGGSVAWPTRWPSAVTVSARSATSTPRSPTSVAEPHNLANAICMHEEDYGILWKHVDLFSGRSGGAAIAAAGGELDLHRRQLRVRVLLVLLPRRHDPAGGEADRASCRRWRWSPAPSRASPPWSLPSLRRRSTSTSSTSASTWRSTDRPTPSTRWRLARCPRARRTRGATPSSPRDAPRHRRRGAAGGRSGHQPALADRQPRRR